MLIGFDNSKAKIQEYFIGLENVTILRRIEPAKNLPDMVFVANAGLISDGKVWVSQFKEPERRGESELSYDWFKKAGFTIESPVDSFKLPPFFENIRKKTNKKWWQFPQNSSYANEWSPDLCI